MSSNKIFSKIGILVLTLSFIAVSFSSCHREGCPGKISKVDQSEQVQENC